MKTLRHCGLIFIVVLTCGMAFGQKSLRDSTISMAHAGITYMGAATAGDLEERFGYSSFMGLEGGYKFRNNIYLNGGFRLLFGNQLREPIAFNVVQLVGNSQTGFSTQAIGADGRFYEVRFFQRGYSIPISIGKVFQTRFSPNPNSGFFVELGAQFIQHKVKIEVIGDNVPQLSNEYKPGYDRLTNGIGILGSVGYRFLSNSRLLNFQVGLEFSQNFTESRRDFNFDLGAADTRKRNDVFYGFRVGWILPIYSDAPDKEYYY